MMNIRLPNESLAGLTLEEAFARYPKLRKEFLHALDKEYRLYTNKRGYIHESDPQKGGPRIVQDFKDRVYRALDCA